MNFLLGFLVISVPNAMAILSWSRMMGVPPCQCERCSLSPATFCPCWPLWWWPPPCFSLTIDIYSHWYLLRAAAGLPLALALHDPQADASSQDLPCVWTCALHTNCLNLEGQGLQLGISLFSSSIGSPCLPRRHQSWPLSVVGHG